MAGIYVHIPFCASRCIYCGFYSTTGKKNMQDEYIDCLLQEYEMRKEYLKGENIDTIYIGGGTPSILSESNIIKLANGISNGHTLKEFTVECNPDDISPTLAQNLKQVGVNRVSMGVQTFSDERLAFLHRRHRSADIPRAIATLREAGIENISIDLMFGFPGETLDEWRMDLHKATALDVTHISAYSLMYEEGTMLSRMLEEGKIEETGEECSADMYDALLEEMQLAGFEHYEISNFAKPGFRSQHNSNYWNGTHYLGLGAAAHSYDGLSRQWNVDDINIYIKGVKCGCLKAEREELDEVTQYNDLITTSLRTREGIDLSTLNDTFRDYIMKSAQNGMKAGNIVIENNRLHLSRKGLYVSDEVLSELIFIK